MRGWEVEDEFGKLPRIKSRRDAILVARSKASGYQTG